VFEKWNHLTAKVLGSDLPVYPIDVNDSNHLRKSNDEEGNRASKAVEQGQPVVPWALHKYKTKQAADQARHPCRQQ